MKLTDKNKKELINRQPDEIEGYVTIDYKDPDTGKVKERIEGKNHVFKDTFQASNWLMLLNDTRQECASFFITDDNSPIDDTFPFLKGNIIGWGFRNSGIISPHQGEYIASDSIAFESYSTFMRHRQSYIFGASQLPGRIGCIGLTAQYMQAHFTVAQLTVQRVNDITLQPIKTRPWNIPQAEGVPHSLGIHSACVTQDNWFYGLPTAIVCQIIKYNLMYARYPFFDGHRLLNPSNTPALSAVVAGTGFTLSIGMDETTGRFYIWAHHATATNRRLYEFADDTFQELLNTYIISNNIFAPHADQRAFAVLNGKMYSYGASTWRIFNYHTNTIVRTITAADAPCPYNNAMWTQWSYMVCFRSGFICFFVATSNRIVFIDPERDWIGGSLALTGVLGGMVLFEPTLDSKPPIFLSTPTGNTSVIAEYRMKQAFCAFTVPDDAPERQPGQMATISYQLDVHY